MKKGDVVARLVDDDATLALARAEATVLEREGELKQAEAARDAAQQRVGQPGRAHARGGVGRGDARRGRGELERLASEIAAEAARVGGAGRRRPAQGEVRRADAASESELVQAKLQLEAQRAVLAATQASEPVLAAKVRQQKAELAAAREQRQAADRRAPAPSPSPKPPSRRRRPRWSRRRSRATRRSCGSSRMEIRSPADGVVMSRSSSRGPR